MTLPFRVLVGLAIFDLALTAVGGSLAVNAIRTGDENYFYGFFGCMTAAISLSFFLLSSTPKELQ